MTGAILDVSLPVGLFVDTCGPVLCENAAQSDASPEPVWRFVGMSMQARRSAAGRSATIFWCFLVGMSRVDGTLWMKMHFK